MTATFIVPDRRRPPRDWIRIGRLLLLLQLVGGTLIVVTVAVAGQRAPSIETIVAVQGEKAVDLERRVKALEDLKVGERLAILDGIQADSRQTKYLTYGGIIALAGNFAFGLLEGRPKRRQADHR